MSFRTSLLLLPLMLAACSGGDKSEGDASTDGPLDATTDGDDDDDGGSNGGGGNGGGNGGNGGTSGGNGGTYGGNGTTGGGWGSTSTTGGTWWADTGTPVSTPAETGAPTADTGMAICDLSEPVELWLSSDDSNSMSSAVLNRSRVLDGYGPSGVRGYEFLNYYTFDYPVAAPGDVEVTVEMVQDPTLPEGDYLLQIGVSSEARSNSERSPLNLAMSLDTSCSMSGEPIARAQDVCRSIASMLRAGDTVSMVTWSTTQEILLDTHAVASGSDPAVTAVCDGLASGGGTDLHSGLVAAYELLEGGYDPAKINRVLLLSDGGANVGVTSADLIDDKAGDAEADGMYMVGVGVGEGRSYNDRLMDQVTDLGKGAAVFIPDAAEASKMFEDRFVNTMDVAVRNVEVQLALPPGFELVRFSGEEVSTERSEVDPQHLAPNDAMVFYQQIHSCAPETVDAASELSVTVHWQDEATFLPASKTVTHSFGEVLGGSSPRLHRGRAIQSYAEALELQTDEATALALEHLTVADAHYPGDAELAEIRTVLEAL